MYVEIFRSGVHTDSSGKTTEYDIQSIDSIVSRYNTRLAEAPDDKAPLVKGHPAADEPALGWVKKLIRRGGSIAAEVEFTGGELPEDIKSGKYRKISVALDDMLNLIHVGFLGAASPAVEGLIPFRYSALSEFSKCCDDLNAFPCNPEMENSSEKEQIEALTRLNREYKQKLTLYEKEIRNAEYRTFIDNLQGSGRIDAARKSEFSKLLEMAHSLDTLSHADGENISQVKNFIVTTVKSEFAREFTKRTLSALPEISDERNINPERFLMHKRVMELLAENPDLTYEDGLKFIGV